MSQNFSPKPKILAALTFILFSGAVLFFSLRPSHAAGQAALLLNPSGGSFLVGSTFDVSVVLDTKGNPANTIEVELNFPADKLQIANPSIGSSVIQLWPAPPTFSNREGKIYFVGGIPAPGINTSNGVVLTFTFRVTAPGGGELSFGRKTAVLANDGRGTNILGQKPSAFFKFLVPAPQGPEVSSPTHPDQERWYKDPNTVFVWSGSRFADAYSFAVDHDPTGVPDASPDSTTATASFENLDDGIWYFHLRERAGGVWGGVSHFVHTIDTRPPASFRVNVSPAKKTTNRNPIFRFFTTDSLSGLDHFEMKTIALSAASIGDAFFYEITSPHQSPTLDRGRYEVILRALDKSGNARDESETVTITGALARFLSADGINLAFVFVPWSYAVLFAASALGALLIAFGIMWKRHQRHLKHAFSEDIRSFFSLLRKVREKAGKKTILTLLIIFSLFAAGRATAEVAIRKAAEISAPKISVAPAVYYPLDEILYLEGQAGPKTRIELFFEKSGSPPVRLEAPVNSSGEWFYSGRLELSSGEWTLRARTAGDPPSDWSNPRIIQSHITGVVLGGFKLRYLPVVSGLAAAVLAAAVLLAYSFLRLRRMQKLEFEAALAEKTKSLEGVIRAKERDETESLIAENFADLRRGIAEELDHLEDKARRGEALTKDEETHRKNLLQNMRRAEEEIEKKIRELD